MAGILTVGVAVGGCGGGSRPGTIANRPTDVGTQVPAASAGPQGLLPPTADPFYRWRGSLRHDPPGTVLRTRSVTVTKDEVSTPVKVIQLLYVTTDELGHRTVSVATVVHPLDKAPSATAPLVSYQAAYDALGVQCEPSYTFPLTLQHETVPVPIPLQYAAEGYNVVTSDYEGEDLAYGAGQQSGYETLDALRAAEKWLGVPETSTPVGLVGYSGGSIATEFASELAHTYAPALDILGVAEGGIPVDLFHNIAYVDNPGSRWTWVIGALMVGLVRGFHIYDIDRFLTPQGIAVVKADSTQCVGHFTDLTIRQMFKPQYQDFTKVPLFVGILDRLIMSRTGTPRAPLFIGDGLSDSIGDGVMVTKDVQQLAYTYCRRGVPVEFHLYAGLSHVQAGQPFLEQAQAFLTQRFEGLPLHDGCSGINPGNSIAPMPVRMNRTGNYGGSSPRREDRADVKPQAVLKGARPRSPV
jgi:hypothetical protein